MLGVFNIISLAALGYIDYKIYKIPNAILLGWILTILVNCLNSVIPIRTNMVVSALVTVGIFYPIRQVVKCNAGDFKLYAVMMLTDDPFNILTICFISMIISLVPMAVGVKKVPLALMTLFGYVTFCLFIRR